MTSQPVIIPDDHDQSPLEFERTVSLTQPVAIPDDHVPSSLEFEHSVCLTQYSIAYVVARGDVDIFAQATTAEGLPTGARRHLLRVSAGGLLLALAGPNTPSHATADVIVTAVGGQMVPRSRAQIDDASLDSWIAALSAALGGAALGTVPIAHPGTQWVLNGGECLQAPVAGVVWLRLKRGGARWCGSGLELTNMSQPIPLACGTWVEAADSTVVHVFGRESLRPTELHGREHLRPTEPWLAIDQFHRLVLDRMGELLRESAQRDAAQIAARARQSDEHVAQLFSRLASLVAPVAALPTEALDSTDALFAAFARAAQALGHPALSPAGRQATDDSFGAIVEMARISGVRVRRVQLRGDWWRREVGALVAWSATTRQPLAVISESTGQCAAIHGGVGAGCRIDAQVAASIAPEAVLLYRTLRADLPSTHGFLSLGLHQGGADLIRLLAGGAIVGLTSLAAPLITPVIIDSVIPDAALGQLGFCILGLAAVAIASAGFQLMQGIALLRLESRFDTVLQAAILDRLLRLPTAYFRRHTAGELADRALAIPAIRRALAGRILRVVTALFGMTNFILMFVYDASLAWVAVGFAVLRLGAVIHATSARLTLESRMADMQGQVQGFIVQLITGVAKLKVAAATSRALGRWSVLFARQKKLAFESQRIGNRQAVIDATLAIVATAAIFAFTPLPRAGTLGQDTGRFIAFLVAFGLSSAAIASLATALSESLAAIPPWRRLLPILSEPLEVTAEREEPGLLAGAIELAEVTFRYVEGGPTVLDQVSLTVAAGESVAIVGPSGSGKSTLFRLLLGFEKAESGVILFDGKPIDRLNVAALRQQFGTVLQQNNILWKSIYDTICGGTGLPLDQAWEAARLAGLAEDIRAMPMGMHTILEGGSSTLSGGQQQRLMIARALVRRPRILLFDEATSALDNITQATVCASLDTLKVTRLFIAHRLSTVRSADRIVVLMNGRVAQQGRFESLAAQPGPFSDLIRRQLQ